MKFTLSWLKEHLDTDASTDAILETLTMIGLEVEEFHDQGQEYAPYSVAEILEAAPHPDADKLQVCKVNTGSETLQIVCGAPNARAGIKVCFAPVGTYVKGIDLTLKKAKIRGVESLGMMCSERELELSDEHNGIMELPADAEVGKPFAEVMGLNDVMIEIAITPNRQDCLGVRGIARDLAAAGLGTLKPLPIEVVEGTFDSPIGVNLAPLGENKDACPIFAGRLIKGVKNGPSPKWLQERLKAIGLRPISALVDVTNYVSFEYARPLHVFDADKLSGDIHVALSKGGEELEALNDKSYTLEAGSTVICDDSGVLGLGGVVGGVPSSCTEETVNVFVESAYFDPIAIATAGRTYQVDSDARYRFERGVDPTSCPLGIDAATQMILDLCGGAEVSKMVVAGEEPSWQSSIDFDPALVQQLGGLDVAKDEVVSILEKLGFGVEDKGALLNVAVPAWRCDVHGKADLVEEVVRIHGLNKVPSVPLPRMSVVANTALSPAQKRRRWTRRALAARGLAEAVTWSFMKTDWAEAFDGGQAALILKNPISSELGCMRPSILPNLIEAAGRNVNRGLADVALFELGPQFAGVSPKEQSLVAAGIRRGRMAQQHWADAGRDVDAFDAKADALAALEAMGAPVDKLQVVAEAPSWYHPGRSGAIKLGPKNTLAVFGEVHPRILKLLDVKGPLVAFEVYLDNIPAPKQKPTRTKAALEVSDLPAVERDFAFLTDAATAVGEMVRAIKGAEKQFLADVTVFDVYEGDKVEAGKKSVAVRVKLQPTTETFTDEQIEGIAGKIVANVAKQTGAELRG